MKKMVLAALVAAFAAGASTAQASTFKYNFCPIDDSCNVDLSEGSLTFETVDGTLDINDYTMTVRFVGTSASLFVDTIDFTAGLEFAYMPVLTSAPAGTVLGDWTTKYDKTNAAAGNNCSGEMTNHLFACAKSTTGNGPSFAGSNAWVFSVDFLGTSVLGASSNIDLRALFVNASGEKAGLMSPDKNNYVFDTTGPSDTTGGGDTTGNIPEPALLTLFGAALALGARRLRARR